MEKQLQLCRDLFQAVLSSKAGCQATAGLNNQLLDALQRLMLELQQLKQVHNEEHTRCVRQRLESVLHLFSRVSCLGPIEAFFTADDLLLHYQRRLDAVVDLTNTLHEQRQQRSAAKATQCDAHMAAVSPSSASGGQQTAASNRMLDSCRLHLPEQQLRTTTSFRQQAAQLCPRLTGSCSPEQLQQLCDTVKEGLVQVNGHSFLIDQGWQLEVSAMKTRAEQLKMLLAHRQAHHITLLASVLLLIHRHEIQQFDLPPPPPPQQQQQVLSTSRLVTHSPSRLSSLGSPSRLSDNGQGLTAYKQALELPAAVGTKAAAAAAVPVDKEQQQQGQQQARIVVAAGLDLGGEGLGEDDEFYMPVAPLPVLSFTGELAPRYPAAKLGPALPFDPGSPSTEASDDGLARMPSSGCSSLLEYVHNEPSGASITGAGAEGSSTTGLHGSGQAVLRRITEEQLQGIAGPEIVSVLAAALGVTLDLGDLDRSERSEICSTYSSSSIGNWRKIWSDWDSKKCDAAAEAATAAADVIVSRPGSAFATHTGGSCSRRSGDATATLEVAARQYSEPILSKLWSSSNTASSPLHPQRPRLLGSGGSSSSTAVDASSNSMSHAQNPRLSNNKKALQRELRLQHMLLPPGCCKSIGAVLYVSPHLTRLALTDVGLTDQAVFDLADALKVNSSIEVLDLSHNKLEDLGARALAGVLRQRAGCSSQLRALYLQDNSIGDDGAMALANSLSHHSTLQRMWLQHNAVGQAGALALATAMQHNTCCKSLKLLPQNTAGLPPELGLMVQTLAKHNKGVREQIKGLLMHVLRSKSDSF